jgi:hypothetical protein
MNIKIWVNMLWMQGLWFTAILGASQNRIDLAAGVLVLFVAWEYRQGRLLGNTLRVLLVALLLGFLLDTTWIKLGLLQFEAGWPSADKAPLWILILWAGLALTLDGSLAWLQDRLVLAGVLGGIFSPLSYMAAQGFGALTIFTETQSACLWGLGLSWAVTLPLLLWLTRALKPQIQTRQAHV